MGSKEMYESHEGEPDGGNIILSICIPTYNRKKQLSELLEGIGNQMRSEVEVCISDNGSSDGTGEYLKSGQKVAKRTHISPLNKGFDENVLSAILLARGRYVWFMGDDDGVEPGGLSKLVETLANAREDDLAFIIDYNEDDLIKHPPAFLSSIILKRDAIVKAGLERIRKGVGTQYIHKWILRMAKIENPKGTIVHLNDGGILKYGDSWNEQPSTLMQQLWFSRGGIKEYTEFLLFSINHRKFLVFAIKKLIGALAFPGFHMMCEREFRKGKNETLSFGSLYNVFGIMGPGLWLFHRVLWALPDSVASRAFALSLDVSKRLGLTRETSYAHWEKFWKEIEGKETSDVHWKRFLQEKEK